VLVKFDMRLEEGERSVLTSWREVCLIHDWQHMKAPCDVQIQRVSGDVR